MKRVLWVADGRRAAWRGLLVAGLLVPGAAGRTVLLDTAGSWRFHMTLAPPVLDGPDGLVRLGTAWLDEATEDPPADWAQPGFNDSAWRRGPARAHTDTPYLGGVRLRGIFVVDDPRGVGDLRLALDYLGGARVMLNGREVARGHYPDAAGGLAEPYPRETFIDARGDLRTYRRPSGDPRVRTLSAEIDPGLLREGINVLGIELIRAPYDRALREAPGQARGGRERILFHGGTCGVRRVQLTAAESAGAVPAAVRPAGIHLWNSDLMTPDFDADFAHPAEPLEPIRLAGLRRGTYSGKVVIGSDAPLHGLRATVGDLAAAPGSGAAGAIASTAVRVRFALPWGGQQILEPHRAHLHPFAVGVTPLDALADEPLEVFPLREAARARAYQPHADDPEPRPGAVVPVWVTVTVPADAAHGMYRGTLSLAAEGLDAEVPVELEVIDGSLPEPGDYRTWVELVQSPDTLSLTYEVAPWSEAHWRLIARSFRLMSPVGNRILHVPLIAQTNLGNAEAMLQWRSGPGGIEVPDTAILERYLDTAIEEMGRPEIVCFWIWDIVMREGEEAARSDHLWLADAIAARQAIEGTGPLITRANAPPAGPETVQVEPLGTDAAEARWRPVFERLRAILDARDLGDAMTLGMLSDARPSREVAAWLNDVTGGAPWALHSHFSVGHRRSLHGVAPVRYQATVWHLAFASDPAAPLGGWKNDWLWVQYERSRDISHWPLASWHFMAEINIVGRQRGVGRIGADFWPALRDRRGALRGYAWSRYLHSSWRNLDIHGHLLAPGPDGPVGTARLEVFREGLQHAEARVQIERALDDPAVRARLGDEAVAAYQALLAERFVMMQRAQSHLQMANPNRYATGYGPSAGPSGATWFSQADPRQASIALYRAAAELARSGEGGE